MKSGEKGNDKKENGIGLSRQYLLFRLGILNWISSRYLFVALSKNMMRWPYLPLGRFIKKIFQKWGTI